MSKQGKHDPRPGTPPSKREEKAAQKEGGEGRDRTTTPGNVSGKGDTSINISGKSIEQGPQAGQTDDIGGKESLEHLAEMFHIGRDIMEKSAFHEAFEGIVSKEDGSFLTVEDVRALVGAALSNRPSIPIEKEPAMAGPTTESLSGDLKEHRSEFRKTADDVIRIGTEVGIFKWAIGLLAVFVLGGVGSGIWWSGNMAGRAASLEDRVTKVENRLTAIEGRLGEMDKHLVAIDASLGRILDRLPPKP